MGSTAPKELWLNSFPSKLNQKNPCKILFVSYGIAQLLVDVAIFNQSKGFFTKYICPLSVLALLPKVHGLSPNLRNSADLVLWPFIYWAMIPCYPFQSALRWVTVDRYHQRLLRESDRFWTVSHDIWWGLLQSSAEVLLRLEKGLPLL